MNNIYSDLKVFHYPAFIENIKTGTNSPLHIRIKLTNRCNHRCSYCAFRNPNQSLGLNINQTDEIPFNKLLEIIQDLVDMDVKAITFSGAGEPTIYKDFDKALLILSRTNIKFAMLTNGSYFNGNVADMFAKYGSWVRISIDGWDRESYKKYRGADDFDKVIENILAFKSDRCLLNLNIVVTKENVNHIHKIIEQIKGSQVKEVKISPCVVGDNVADNVAYHSEHKIILDSQVKRIRDMGINVAYTYHNQFDEFQKDYTFCPNIQMRPVIGADCNIYSCHDKAYEKAGFIGSFKDCSFKEAWEKADKFKINPSQDCQHHCIAHQKNKMVHSFLNIYQDHREFV